MTVLADGVTLEEAVARSPLVLLVEEGGEERKLQIREQVQPEPARPGGEPPPEQLLEHELRVIPYVVQQVLKGDPWPRIRRGERIETVWNWELTALHLKRTQLGRGCRMTPIDSELDARPPGERDRRKILLSGGWDDDHQVYVTWHVVSSELRWRIRWGRWRYVPPLLLLVLVACLVFRLASSG